jgi:predicted dehydrogenase
MRQSIAVEDQTRVLRVLHIGVANRGRWPLDRCKPDIGFRSAMLCDVNAAALTEARNLTGLPSEVCFSDIDQALDAASRGAADCVIACVPTKFHVPLAMRAIDLGLPVMIEKGMAPDWPSAQRLADHVARHPNARAAVAQNYRYNPVERGLVRAFNDDSYPGYIGKPHFLEYTQLRVRPSPGTLTYPFASIWDMSCHHFDNLLAWLGPISAITAQSWRADYSPYEHDPNTTAHIEFASGTRVHYVHTHDAARNVLTIEAHSALGAIRTSPEGLIHNARPLEQFGGRPETILPRENAHGETDLLRDFYAYVVHGIEPGVSVRNNLEVMAACEMMVRSITSGRRVVRDELAGALS